MRWDKYLKEVTIASVIFRATPLQRSCLSIREWNCFPLFCPFPKIASPLLILACNLQPITAIRTGLSGSKSRGSFSQCSAVIERKNTSYPQIMSHLTPTPLSNVMHFANHSLQHPRFSEVSRGEDYFGYFEDVDENSVMRFCWLAGVHTDNGFLWSAPSTVPIG